MRISCSTTVLPASTSPCSPMWRNTGGSPAKASQASSTVRCSTSAIDRPFHCISRVAALWSTPWQVGYGQRLHAHHAPAFAGLAAPLGCVEKTPCVVAPLARGRRGDKQLAHGVQQTGVRGHERGGEEDTDSSNQNGWQTKALCDGHQGHGPAQPANPNTLHPVTAAKTTGWPAAPPASSAERATSPAPKDRVARQRPAWGSVA